MTQINQISFTLRVFRHRLQRMPLPAQNDVYQSADGRTVVAVVLSSTHEARIAVMRSLGAVPLGYSDQTCDRLQWHALRQRLGLRLCVSGRGSSSEVSAQNFAASPASYSPL